MLEETRAALEGYKAKWSVLVAGRADQSFFGSLQPTAVGWKTSDMTDFDRRYAELRDVSDQIHLGWVNERWLATFYLKEALSPWDMRVVKLMQRRPGSTDAVDLDHVDFLLPKNVKAKPVLELESGLEWTEELNGEFCKWISVWFDGTEAKLRSDTVLQVCADEMLEYQDKLLESDL